MTLDVYQVSGPMARHRGHHRRSAELEGHSAVPQDPRDVGQVETDFMPRFVVDSSKTTVDVGLKVNVHPSHIKASGLTGFIECELTADGKPNLDAPYSAELTLPVDGIKSGNSLQDREMRRRFDASKYPTITAKVTKGEALPDGRYRAIAQLSMHGVTREIDG